MCRPQYVNTPGYIHNAIRCNTVLITDGYSIKYNLAHRDSSVGVATHYGTDDRGIESRWVRGATHPSRQALGISQPPLHSVTSDEVTGEWRKLRNCAGGKIEKNEMGGACGAYGGGERCAQGFGW